MALLAVAGQAFSAFGAAQEGQDTGNALDSQARIQRRNAANAIIAAKQDAYKQSLMSAKQYGAAEASYAAGGVASNSGSVLGVLAASAANAELDRQNILYGGDIRALSYQNQASIDESNARRARDAGTEKALSFGIGAATKSYAGGGGA